MSDVNYMGTKMLNVRRGGESEDSMRVLRRGKRVGTVKE